MHSSPLEEDAELPAEPEPFGGLLLLVALWVVIAPLYAFGWGAFLLWGEKAFRQLRVNPGVGLHRAHDMHVAALQIAQQFHTWALVEFGFGIFALVIAVFFFRKSRLTPWLIAAYTLFHFILAAVVVLASEDGATGSMPSASSGALVSACFGLVWVLYLLTSDRAARTFVR